MCLPRWPPLLQKMFVRARLQKPLSRIRWPLAHRRQQLRQRLVGLLRSLLIRLCGHPQWRMRQRQVYKMLGVATAL